MTRSEESAAALREAGAAAAVVDVFDAAALNAAMAEAKPEVVVHQLTAIPDDLDPRKMEAQFETTNRLRTEGTRNLLAAARACGARPHGRPEHRVRLRAARRTACTTRTTRSGPRPRPSIAAVAGDGGPGAGRRGPGGARAALRLLLRARHQLRAGRRHRRDGAQAPVPGDGRRPGRVAVHPHRRRGVGHRGRGGARRPGRLQRGGRRARAAARVAARLRGGDRREEAVPRAQVRGPAGGGQDGHPLRDRAARRVERERFKQEFGWEPRYASWREGFREGLG